MKKILLATAALFSTLYLAQRSEFSNNYSTKSLRDIQKTTPQNEKRELYKQYFRALLVEEMKYKFSYKNYSEEGLRKFADTIIANNTNGENSNESTEIIKKIDDNFVIDSANSNENYHLLAENMGIYPEQMFPIVSSVQDEFSIFEIIPGEILTYSQQSGVFTGLYFSSYITDGSNVEPINPYPNDNKFIDKVSKYAKSGWRFQPKAGYGIEKNKLGEYIISTSLYTAEDSNAAPSMSIEYKTKDFKNFTPLRIAKNVDENPVWKEIK